MPGGKGNRTKGNVKPSSSSRAAELLSQSGAAPAGFIGFGTQAYVPASQAFEDEDTSLDSDFRVVLRKLTKRDATTKVKALGELCVLCKEKDDATLLAVLPFWPRLFNRLALDTDAKVRESTQNAMAVLVSRVKKNLAPYLRNVMGAWILSQNDTYPTVASAANKSFRAAFPPEKQENAIVFCKQQVTEYMVDNLVNQTAATLSDPKTTEKEEMEAKLVRVQCSSLLGLRHILLTLPKDQLDDHLVGLLRGLLNEASFWNLAKSPHVLVRSGLFWFVGGACQTLPSLVNEYVAKLSPIVLCSVDVTEPALIAAVWDAVLSLVKFVPSCWEKVNFQKAFWPKLMKLLEGACCGNAGTVAPNLLPLVASIPVNLHMDGMYPRILQCIITGLDKESIANIARETNPLVRAYMECLQFAIKQISSNEALGGPRALGVIVMEQLLSLVETSLYKDKPALWRSRLFWFVSALLRTLTNKEYKFELSPSQHEALTENGEDVSSLAAAFFSALMMNLERFSQTDAALIDTNRLVLLVTAVLAPAESAGANAVSRTQRGVRFVEGKSDSTVRFAEGKSESAGVRFAEGKSDSAGVRFTEGKSDSAGVRFAEGKSDSSVVKFAEGKSDPAELTSASATNQQSDTSSAELYEEARAFVKRMVVYAYKRYRQEKTSSYFDFFVRLAILYFPADLATHVLENLDKERPQKDDASKERGEDRNADSRDRDTDSSTKDTDSSPHSAVIDRVVLPVLVAVGAESSTENSVMMESAITLLFACLPYLSQQHSTQVWDNVLRTVSSSRSLSFLIERALEKRKVMPQVSDWLSSQRLHARLLDLVTLVTTQHSTLPRDDLSQGWRVLCLVLSANDDNEPVFPSSWVMDVVNCIHAELVALGSRSLNREDTYTAIEFVASASFIFFKNLKMSLRLSEGRDMIIALLMADLDVSFPSAGDLRLAWTKGLAQAVSGTGGLIMEGNVLASACNAIRDTLLHRTRSLEQYSKVVNLTEEVLKVTQNSLPPGTSDTDTETYNPVLVLLLSDLVVYPQCSASCTRKVLERLCLNGTLPLSELDKVAHPTTTATGEDNSADMPTVVFSALFNLRLLDILRSGFQFGAEASGGEVVEEDEVGEMVVEVMLYAVRVHMLAGTWVNVQTQALQDVVSTVKDLSSSVESTIASSSRSVQQKMISTALARMTEDASSAMTACHLLTIIKSQAAFSVDQLQQMCSEKMDSAEGREEILVPYLPSHKLSELVSLQAAMLTSVTEQTLPTAISWLRVMAKCLVSATEELVVECSDLLTATLTQLKTMRDDDQFSPLFLFACDISEEPNWRVAFNMAVMSFFSAVVGNKHYSLNPDCWDFVLCSTVSWIEGLTNSGMSLASPVSIQAFGVEACRLSIAVASPIQHVLPQRPDSFPPNLKSEWEDFFSEGIYGVLFPLFVRLVDESKRCERQRDADLILRAAGSAMSQCPLAQVTAHSLPPNLQASDDTSPIPENVQTLLNHLCPALISPLATTQITAFTLLDRIITLLPGFDKEREDSEEATAEKEHEPRPLPHMLMKIVDDCTTAMDVVLAAVPMESTVTMEAGSEEYQFALGYLLAWRLLLHLFHSAASQQRAEYANHMKEHSNVERLLSHLFRMMPTTPGSASVTALSPVKAVMNSPCSPPAVSVEVVGSENWFSSSVLPFTADDVGESKDIQRLSCSLYAQCLEVIPGLVRQWWKDQDRKSAAFVERFTTKHVSPHLIRSEIQSVNRSGSDIADLTVKASSVSRTVTASYTTEELKAEINITLPESYPLGEITVQAPKHAVVRQAQWEKLLLQLNVFLQHQNGSMMEGLRLWKRNIDKRLEGVEECFICYAVIHATTYQLPRVPCKTCHKKFHSDCLYKWLNSSQNSTCPLCRSVF